MVFKNFKQFINETHNQEEMSSEASSKPRVGELRTVLDLDTPDYEMIQVDAEVEGMRNEFSLTDDYTYYWYKNDADGDYAEIWGGNSPNHGREVECLWVAR